MAKLRIFKIVIPLAAKDPQAPERKGYHSPRNLARSWADRMSDSEEVVMDYLGTVAFSDPEAEEQQSGKVVEVSEKAKKLSMRSALGECQTRRGKSSESVTLS